MKLSIVLNSCLLVSAANRPQLSRPDECSGSFGAETDRSEMSEDYKVYVGGTRPFLRILRLTKIEYMGLAARDGLLPSDLIVIDEMPSDIEPQVVAGIIAGTRFHPHSHLSMTAEKLGIPLIYERECISKKELIALAETQQSGVFKVPVLNSKYTILKKPIQSFDFRLKPINQEKIDRDFSEILSWEKIAEEMPSVTKSRFGEKIENLAQATSSITSKSHPEFLGIPFALYFGFISSVQVSSTETLEQFIAKKSKENKSHQATPEIISQSLKQIRDVFEQSEIPEHLLEKIASSIETYVGSLHRELRIRSSNDVEDSLGAGVYDSIIVEKNSSATRSERKAAISKAIRKVWASLYTYRAYQVRKVYGLSEDEVAMALLIHLSYQAPLATGVATFRRYYGNAVGDFVAYPGNLSATSPTSDATFKKFQIHSKLNHETDLIIDGKRVSANLDAYSPYGPFKWYEDLLISMQMIDRYWINPHAEDTEIELSFEWIVVQTPSKEGQSSSTPIILQVKPIFKPYSRKGSTLSPSIPPSIAKNLLKKSASNLDPRILQWLKAHDFQTLTDFILSQTDKFGKIKHSPFMFVEINGEKIILFTNTAHVSAYYRLRGYFDEKSIPFRVLDYGRMSASYYHTTDDELHLSKISNINLRDHDHILLPPSKREADYSLLRDELLAFILNGAIKIDETSEYLISDVKFFPFKEFKRGRFLDLLSEIDSMLVN